MSEQQALPGQLTLEQELELQVLEKQVRSLTLEQVQESCCELMYQLMVKENLIRHLLGST